MLLFVFLKLEILFQRKIENVSIILFPFSPAVADDSLDHVRPLCLGPAEPGYDGVILVWDTF